jgi:tellurite resistance protein TerC
MLFIDLGFFNKKAHKPSLKESVIWSIVWITCSLLFNAGVFYFQGNLKGMEFLTGYIVEKALSVDNIFVFVLVFSYFSVPLEYQHKVLFWGIIGALFMRASFILLGTVLIKKFHFICIIRVLLVYGGYKIMFHDDEQIDPGKKPFSETLQKDLPCYAELYRFKILHKRRYEALATPLLPVLVVIETTDLLFAIDQYRQYLQSHRMLLLYIHQIFLQFLASGHLFCTGRHNRQICLSEIRALYSACFYRRKNADYRHI